MDNEDRPVFNFCDLMRSWDKETPMYEVYQIRIGSQSDESKFCGSDMIEKLGLQLDGEDYDIVYAAPLKQFEGTATLEEIYVELNQNQTFDYRGHSLSVSDVLVIRSGKEDKAYYVDSIGFKEFPEFLDQRRSIQDPLENIYSDQERNKAIAIRNLIRGNCVFLVGDKYIDIDVIDTARGIACYYAVYGKELDLLGRGDFLAYTYTGISDELEGYGFCLAEAIPINREAFHESIALQTQEEIYDVCRKAYGDMFEDKEERSVTDPINVDTGRRKRAPKR